VVNTIAKELVKYGYVLCDNHLINNPILSILPEGQIPWYAWDAIDEIREIVLRIVRQQLDSPNFNKPGFVFTNVLYKSN
jgi:YD repeat-containing protein